MRHSGIAAPAREETAFEVEVFFQYSAKEAQIIEERRRPAKKAVCAGGIGNHTFPLEMNLRRWLRRRLGSMLDKDDVDDSVQEALAVLK